MGGNCVAETMSWCVIDLALVVQGQRAFDVHSEANELSVSSSVPVGKKPFPKS